MWNESRAVAVATAWVAVLVSAPLTLRAAEPASADFETSAADGDGSGRLEDVVVTARRRAENIQDVLIHQAVGACCAHGRPHVLKMAAAQSFPELLDLLARG